MIAAHDEAAIITSRGAVRELARAVGFSTCDQTRLVTAVSEIVRNVVLYAKHGHVTVSVTKRGGEDVGIEVVVEDEGPGIEDIPRVLEGGYSTSGGFGRGVSGAQALVDDFRITTELGAGTRVELRKWR